MADGNMMDPKYKGKYKGASDWIGSLIDEHCMDEGDDGKRTGLNLEKLFEFAEANGVDTAKYRDQADRPHAAGRLRMTIGNTLRARARRRHGLYAPDGTKRLKAPEEFLASAPEAPTETLDGEKIAKKKEAKDESSAEKPAKKKGGSRSKKKTAA